MQPAVTSRLKIMGKLDIADRRSPTDGRVTAFFGTGHIDMRIAVLATTLGVSNVGFAERERRQRTSIAVWERQLVEDRRGDVRMRRPPHLQHQIELEPARVPVHRAELGDLDLARTDLLRVQVNVSPEEPEETRNEMWFADFDSHDRKRGTPRPNRRIIRVDAGPRIPLRGADRCLSALTLAAS